VPVGGWGMAFFKFCGSVWNHWEARFGTTFAVMLAVAQYLLLEFLGPKKIPVWVRDFPPSIWLGIGALLLFWSCYGAWHDEFAWHMEAKEKIQDIRPRLLLIVDQGRYETTFFIRHLGGQAAQFIQIETIKCPWRNDFRMKFDEVNFLDSTRNSVQLNCILNSDGLGDFSDSKETGKVSWIFFRKQNEGHAEIVTYPIAIRYKWKDCVETEYFRLIWDYRDKSLKVAPPN
jgi:hypothetical protein